jgi:hypothetical protein
MAKKIPLTEGLFATVDDEDYEWLSAYDWIAVHTEDGKTYAGRLVNDGTDVILMHEEIMRRASVN